MEQAGKGSALGKYFDFNLFYQFRGGVPGGYVMSSPAKLQHWDGRVSGGGGDGIFLLKNSISR